MEAIITQPPLPFAEYKVSRILRRCFHLANAANFPEKRWLFYPFKDRFLEAHAVFDGYDLQTIHRGCRCCDGTGIWEGYHGQRDCCYHCHGTGTYRTDRVALSRWDLYGAIYHIPRSGVNIALITPKASFTGILRHEHVTTRTGRICLAVLLLRYEPRSLWAWAKHLVHKQLNRAWHPLWGEYGFLRSQYREAYVDYCKPKPDPLDDIPF